MATRGTADESRRAEGVLRDGPMPKHAQLREILRALASEELLPGSPVPSERELAVRYGVSRLTVREAVGQLVAEGLLVRVRGKGTFTTRPRVDSQLHLASFTEDMLRRGMHPETVLLEAAEAVPPEDTAEALGLAPRGTAYWLHRLRKADGAPMAVERGWYHAGLLPGLLHQDLTDSMYTLLDRRYGVQLETGTQTVLAEGADADTARLLGVRPGSPVLVFRRIATAQGRPIEDMTSWYRGDLYQVTMQLDRDPSGSGQHRPTIRPT
ncbi:GntR family transcriptional regulator [Saccharopolyspora antimicrobica]|uniref:GntR family transcriptional regulator n=2 Tax=Saccharopolyspora antimicrobica TaxID=455193 RepID=A0A1I5BEU0_9PSEU|nr:GntR family transcriptional regulator [Saccharopolyspora antimicrobica]SFN73235.1 GntR family transcriptional regulator [Saccharopolyspora antimicrobica]